MQNVLAQVDEASEAAPTVEKLAADGLTPAAPRRSFHDLDALEKLTVRLAPDFFPGVLPLIVPVLQIVL